MIAERPIRILMQATIQYIEDDWNIGRFSLLESYLRGLRDEDRRPQAEVTVRNREPRDGVDEWLASVDSSDFDQIWLFAADADEQNGLNAEECAALTRFRKNGGAVVAARDHQDLGASLRGIGEIGKALYFHTSQRDPDQLRNVRDDDITMTIDYPNYHSGSNGGVQAVVALDPRHAVLRGVSSLPSHPHERAVGAPPDDASARVVAVGTSRVTGRSFNIAVAFESRDGSGRGWAESTFHHFCDYNWDVRSGCPTFVSEPPSKAILLDPSLLDDTKRYVANLVVWLGKR